MRCQDVRRALPLLVAGEMPLTEWALSSRTSSSAPSAEGSWIASGSRPCSARASGDAAPPRRPWWRPRWSWWWPAPASTSTRPAFPIRIARPRPHATAPVGAADDGHAGGPAARAGDLARGSGRAPDSARSARTGSAAGTRPGHPHDPDGGAPPFRRRREFRPRRGNSAPSGAGSARRAPARRAAGGGAHADSGAPTRRRDRGAGRRRRCQRRGHRGPPAESRRPGRPAQARPGWLFSGWL